LTQQAILNHFYNKIKHNKFFFIESAILFLFILILLDQQLWLKTARLPASVKE